MLTAEQARLALHYDQRDRQAQACQQRLVTAARLQRRARRQAERAERASRRAATAEARARLAWAELV
jgi:hypothetical protein